MPKHAAHAAPTAAVPRRLPRAAKVALGVALAGALALGGLVAAGQLAFVGPFTPAPTFSAEESSALDGHELGEHLGSWAAAPANAAREALAAGIEEARLAASPELRLDRLAAHTPTAAEVAALPGSASPFAFCLGSSSPDGQPALSSEHAAALEAALAPFEQRGVTAGFLLVDLSTGRGIAANLDAPVYGASAIKGPFALYLCEALLETGAATRETLVSESVAGRFVTESLAGDTATSYPLGALVERSIVDSDNDSYRVLRAAYGTAAYRAWLEDAGVRASLADDTWFPRYSAREAALLWLRMDAYLQGETGTSAWLQGLLGATEQSFIRNAVGSESVQVINKGGWIASADAAFNGICDAGIVEKDGHRWLCAVMTGAADSDESERQVEALVAALWAARGSLA